MTMALTPDTLKENIGKEIGVSEWTVVSQEQVNQFADATHDHQFIHIDPEAAAKTPFGGPIAHGFLSLSLLSHFAQTGAGVGMKDSVMGINYGLNKVRFIQPVRVGSRIRGRSVLLAAEQKNPNQYLFTQSVTIEIEGSDKPAALAEWLTMAVVG